MTAFTKLVMVLVLVLPVGAYVTGTLMASQAEVPADRPAIVIDDASSPSPDASPRPTRRPSDRPTDDNSGGGGDDDVKVINPTPGHLDDNGGRGDDDNSGPGGGGSGNSGSGSSDGSDDD